MYRNVNLTAEDASTFEMKKALLSGEIARAKRNDVFVTIYRL